jgi:hypothetical protein
LDDDFPDYVTHWTVIEVPEDPRHAVTIMNVGDSDLVLTHTPDEPKALITSSAESTDVHFTEKYNPHSPAWDDGACTTCSGHGHVSEQDYDAKTGMWLSSFVIEDPCPRCLGTGYEPPPEEGEVVEEDAEAE